MPVTFGVVAHDAKPDQRMYHSADGILRHAGERTATRVGELLQSSVSPSEYPAVHPSPNGFVHTVLEAWGQHRNLVIR